MPILLLQDRLDEDEPLPAWAFQDDVVKDLLRLAIDINTIKLEDTSDNVYNASYDKETEKQKMILIIFLIDTNLCLVI